METKSGTWKQNWVGVGQNARAMDDREFLLNLSEALMDLLEESLHAMNCAARVAMTLPDWNDRYNAELKDDLLRQYTVEKVAGLRMALAAARQGWEGDPRILEEIAKLRRPPN